MRHSRRATLASGGKVWEKYEYNYVFTKELKGYKIESQAKVGWTGMDTLNGYEDCEIVLKQGKYYDHYAYELSYYTATYIKDIDTKSKTVWNKGTSELSVFEDVMWADRMEGPAGQMMGDVDRTALTIVNQYENERWEWWVEDYVGIVNSKDGHYPDEGRGYSFVKTDGEYTIMTDGEKQYAYKMKG